MSSRYKKRTQPRTQPKKSRPSYRSCGKMVFGDAKRALLVANSLRKLINVEIKNHDTQQTSVPITDTIAIIPLTNIPQDITTITRDGAQCKMLGFNLNYSIRTSVTAPRTAVRIMVVVDKQTNQAIYVAGDLLKDTTTQDSIISPINLNNLHRFTILYDVTHVISLDRPVVVVRKYIAKELLLRFDASTPGIQDLTQNSLSLLQVSNEVTNDPAITSFLRIRFVDN